MPHPLWGSHVGRLVVLMYRMYEWRFDRVSAMKAMTFVEDLNLHTQSYKRVAVQSSIQASHSGSVYWSIASPTSRIP